MRSSSGCLCSLKPVRQTANVTISIEPLPPRVAVVRSDTPITYTAPTASSRKPCKLLFQIFISDPSVIEPAAEDCERLLAPRRSHESGAHHCLSPHDPSGWICLPS